MQGLVYQLQLAQLDSNQPHPHVIVLTFFGNKDCIVVPAYSADGFRVNQYIAAMKRRGFSEDQIFVELDNSVHIKFHALFPGKVARWCPFPVRRVPLRIFESLQPIGEMDDEGMLRIVRCFLSGGSLLDAALSPHAIKQLQRLEKELVLKTSKAT